LIHVKEIRVEKGDSEGVPGKPHPKE